MSKGAYIGALKAEYEPAFADNSWRQIIKACQKNEVPSTWAVGDSKTMKINGTDYSIDIIGKNHDTYADGSGTAPLTFQLHDCYATKYAMGDNLNGNSPGWTNCVMRKTNLSAILALMPTEVQAGIKEVNKLTSVGSQNSTINTTADKLFLLSEIEVFGKASESFSGEGSQYAYYAAGNSKIKNFSGSASAWCLRSPWSGNQVSYCVVTLSGTAYAANAPNTNGVAFAFCFGGTSEVDSVLGGYGIARKIKKGYVGIEGLARKIKKAYIGVPTEFPVYEEPPTTATLTIANIEDYFTVTNGTYGFVGDASGKFSGSTATTASGLTSKSTWTAKHDIPDMSLKYSTGSKPSTNANFKFTITVAGKKVVAETNATNPTSASISGTATFSLKAGEDIVITACVGSVAPNVRDISLTAKKQIGSEIKSVAKLCWAGDNPVYTERMVVYQETNTLNFTDLPFEPKYFALETLGTIPSASTIYVASIYADKESGLMRIVYKASSQSGFLQYKETYDGDGDIKVQWGKNSFYAYLVSYKFYSHSTSGVPYRVTIWG